MFGNGLAVNCASYAKHDMNVQQKGNASETQGHKGTSTRELWAMIWQLKYIRRKNSLPPKNINERFERSTHK